MSEDRSKRERINAYTCETCRQTIGTVDREEGVTPMFLLCRATSGCGGSMTSHMHRSNSGVLFITPTFEWRKPTPQERETCSKDTLEHVDRGGLLIYPIAEVSA